MYYVLKAQWRKGVKAQRRKGVMQCSDGLFFKPLSHCTVEPLRH